MNSVKLAAIILVKGRNSWICIISFVTIAFVLGCMRIPVLEVLPSDREHAYDLLTENLSNIGSFLGIGLAILAIIFTIIQLSYRRLTIIRLVIEDSYFIPMFYFGAINMGISAALLLFRAGDTTSSKAVIDTFHYTRFAIIESYLFYGFIAGMCIVFYRTLRFINFQRILQVFLNDVNNMIALEISQRINDADRMALTERGSEIRGEMEIWITENKIIVTSEVFKHFYSIIERNPTSVYLSGFESAFPKWIIHGIKTGDIDTMRRMYNYLDTFYVAFLEGTDQRRARFVNNIPVSIYELYRQTNDPEIKKILGSAIFKRLTQTGVFWFVKQSYQGGMPQPDAIQKGYVVIQSLQNLLQQLVHDNEISLIDQLLNELKLGRQSLGADDEFGDALESIAAKQVGSEEQKLAWIEANSHMANYLFELPFYVFCYLSYQLLEGEAQWPDTKVAHDHLKLHLQIGATRLFAIAIEMFNRSDEHPLMPLNSWIRRDQLSVEGKTYFIENSEIPIAVGLIILFHQVPMGDAEVTHEQLHRSDNFVHYLQVAINRYKANPVLANLLGVKDGTDPATLLANLENQLAGIRTGVDDERAMRLVAKQLSQQRIDEFRAMIYQQWALTRNINSLLDANDAASLQSNTNRQVGLNQVKIKHGKAYFVESGNQVFVGDFNFGRQVNDMAWKYFLHTVLQDPKRQQGSSHSFMDALDLILAKYKEVTHAIVSAGAYTANYGALIESGLFSADVRAKGVANGGLYKNKLFVVPFEARFVDDTIIGLKLPGSIQLQQKTDDSWMGGKLQIEVKEIDDTEAKRQITISKPPGDPYDPAQILRMKTGVLVKVNEFFDYEVLDWSTIVEIRIKS